ncbi:MAG: hypothetical protein HQ556_11730 [Candidatus Marinimicrobia bacterium]|nr:hypothetical protein [Candidatus Neomarinimicrobiota bacterium]
MNFNKPTLSDLTLFDHEEEGFSVDQVIDLFPNTISTHFEVTCQKEANLLYGLITYDPFLVPEHVLNPLSDFRPRSGKSISASVLADEDVPLESTPDYFLFHFPEQTAELLLSQLTSKK